MQAVSVRTFEEWREAARPLLASGVRWDEVDWQPQAGPPPSPALAGDLPSVRLPRSLLDLLSCLADYRHAGRWHLMYRLAWRTLHENRSLLEDEADADVRHALA